MCYSNEAIEETSVPLAFHGDICAFIRPFKSLETSKRTPYMCLFVAHQKPRERSSNERETITWISQVTENDVLFHGSSSVIGFPELKQKSRSCSEKKSDIVPKIYGTLSDGNKFLKYPLLLYHDDFNPSSTLYHQGSVGRCYFVQLGFSAATRSTVNSARIITLTTYGCCTVSALRFIVNDLVSGSTKGIEGKYPFGNNIKIFLDIVGFVADYPASSPVLDIKSHTADAHAILGFLGEEKSLWV